MKQILGMVLGTSVAAMLLTSCGARPAESGQVPGPVDSTLNTTAEAVAGNQAAATAPASENASTDPAALLTATTAQSEVKLKEEEVSCTGEALDFDMVKDHCALETKEPEFKPTEAQLAMDIFPEVAKVAAGKTRLVKLRMTNISKEALTVDITDCCFDFETAILKGDARVDKVSECGMLCGNCPNPVRVTLPPGGHLFRKLKVTATKTVIKSSGMTCTAEPPVLLDPGDYTLVVTSPIANLKAKKKYKVNRKAETVLRVE